MINIFLSIDQSIFVHTCMHTYDEPWWCHFHLCPSWDLFYILWLLSTLLSRSRFLWWLFHIILIRSVSCIHLFLSLLPCVFSFSLSLPLSRILSLSLFRFLPPAPPPSLSLSPSLPPSLAPLSLSLFLPPFLSFVLFLSLSFSPSLFLYILLNFMQYSYE